MYSFWIELNWIVLLNGSGPGIRFQDQYPTITKSQCLLQITGVSASILAFTLGLRGSLDALSCTTKDRSTLWIAWYWLWVKERKLRCERKASLVKPYTLAARLAEGESGCGKPSGLCLRYFVLTCTIARITLIISRIIPLSYQEFYHNCSITLPVDRCIHTQLL